MGAMFVTIFPGSAPVVDARKLRQACRLLKQKLGQSTWRSFLN